MGYPNRTSRLALGPKYVNKRPVRDGTKEVGSQVFNLLLQCVAGGTQVSDRAWALIHIAAGVVTVTANGEAWNPDGGFVPTPAYVAAGHYRLTYPATANDENGVAVALALLAGKAHPQTSASLFGTVLIAGNVVDIYTRNDAGALTEAADVLVEIK